MKSNMSLWCDAYAFEFEYTGKNDEGKEYKKEFTLFDIEIGKVNVWIEDKHINPETIKRRLL